jgi:ubiquinone/menaquinone biosynthesis C-methylase UbiE
MMKHKKSGSKRSEDISDHYASGYEIDRLTTGDGKIERERSRDLLKRFLPQAPATILDVGGGPGRHACWLAGLGYKVHLIDIVPLHVEQAKQASKKQPDTPLASATVGDACELLWDTESADAVLLFGPLYHLTARQDRKKSLSEAHRVLKPKGVLLAVGISRFASALSGLRYGLLKDPQFVKIVDQDLKNGQHRNPTNHPDYFTNAFFHHPDELRNEVSGAGFTVDGIYGVEGLPGLIMDIDDWWNNETHRQQFLRIARALETEPSLLGVSSHLMAVARKK